MLRVFSSPRRKVLPPSARERDQSICGKIASGKEMHSRSMLEYWVQSDRPGFYTDGLSISPVPNSLQFYISKSL